MKPRTLGEVTADDIDGEKMLSEKEEERDGSETEGEFDEELMFCGSMSEEVLNETCHEFVLEHLPTDTPIKLEMEDDLCAAGFYSEARVFLPEWETAKRFKPKINNEKLSRESEECDFEFESERAQVERHFAEFDEVLRRKAIVVLERCVLPLSFEARTMEDCKAKNKTDGKKRRVAVVEKKRKRIKKFSLQHVNENIIKSSDVARKCGQVEFVRKREVCAQQIKVFKANAESIRKTSVLETTGQRVKCLKTQSVNYERPVAKETTEQYEKFLAAINQTHEELLEKRKKQLASHVEYRRKRRESQTPEQRRVRRANSAERKRMKIKNETAEQRKQRLANNVEYRRKRRENETLEERKKRLVAYNECRRKRWESKTPEERKKRLAANNECKRKWKERKKLEQGEKCQAAAIKKRRDEGIEKEMPKQLEKCQLAVIIEDELSSKVGNEDNNFIKSEAIDADEVGLPFQDACNIMRIKSEAAFAIEDEDSEIEIDFEAYCYKRED